MRQDPHSGVSQAYPSSDLRLASILIKSGAVNGAGALPHRRLEWLGSWLWPRRKGKATDLTDLLFEFVKTYSVTASCCCTRGHPCL